MQITNDDLEKWARTCSAGITQDGAWIGRCPWTNGNGCWRDSGMAYGEQCHNADCWGMGEDILTTEERERVVVTTGNWGLYAYRYILDALYARQKFERANGEDADCARREDTGGYDDNTF